MDDLTDLDRDLLADLYTALPDVLAPGGPRSAATLAGLVARGLATEVYPGSSLYRITDAGRAQVAPGLF